MSNCINALFLEKIYFGKQLAISAIVGHQSQLCFFCFEAGEKGKKFVLKVWSAAASQYVEQDLNKSEIQDQNSHNIKGNTIGCLKSPYFEIPQTWLIL